MHRDKRRREGGDKESSLTWDETRVCIGCGCGDTAEGRDTDRDEKEFETRDGQGEDGCERTEKCV